ncbi:MAG TPA: hypothetical protein VFT50_01190 [Baekduia sp.]|nr:hypothetical protein [Baekduia sp.]
MVPRGHRIVLWTFAAIVLVWTIGETVAGVETGLLYLAPALVLALPLVLGRYLGEDQLADLARRPLPAPRRRAAASAAPRSHVRVMERGGRLVASALAKRPPPPGSPAPMS